MSDTSQIVQKLWNYCNILRDDGLSYGDYLEQLTFFAFPQNGKRAEWAAIQQEVADSARVFVAAQDLTRRSRIYSRIFGISATAPSGQRAKLRSICVS